MGTKRQGEKITELTGQTAMERSGGRPAGSLPTSCPEQPPTESERNAVRSAQRQADYGGIVLKALIVGVEDGCMYLANGLRSGRPLRA